MEYYVVNSQGVVKKLENSFVQSVSVDFGTTNCFRMGRARHCGAPFRRNRVVNRKGRLAGFRVAVLCQTESVSMRPSS
jgi:hypothetical protein